MLYTRQVRCSKVTHAEFFLKGFYIRQFLVRGGLEVAVSYKNIFSFIGILFRKKNRYFKSLKDYLKYRPDTDRAQAIFLFALVVHGRCSKRIASHPVGIAKGINPVNRNCKTQVHAYQQFKVTAKTSRRYLNEYTLKIIIILQEVLKELKIFKKII